MNKLDKAKSRFKEICYRTGRHLEQSLLLLEQIECETILPLMYEDEEIEQYLEDSKRELGQELIDRLNSKTVMSKISGDPHPFDNYFVIEVLGFKSKKALIGQLNKRSLPMKKLQEIYKQLFDDQEFYDEEE